MYRSFLSPPIFFLLLIIFVGLIAYIAAKKSKTKANIKQKEKDSEIITEGIVDLYSQCKHLESVIEKVFNFSDEEDSSDFPPVSSKIQTKVKEYIEICFFAPIKPVLQELFDQILRMYAKDMEDAYSDGDGIKKEINSRDSRYYMKLSAIEIDQLLRSRDYNETTKKDRKEKFWKFHNTIKKFGFKTWGDEASHKVYLLLKPSELSVK